MERDIDRARSFTRRAFLIGALQGSFLTVLGGRLAWLQISQGQKYRMLADNNRINIKMLAPSRGQIVDLHGTPLATNGQNFRVLLVPEQTKDISMALSQLQKYLPLSQREIRVVLKQASQNPSFVPIAVKENLEWEDMARIEVNLPDLPGISIDEGEIRNYPLGEVTATITGYVGAVSKTDLNGDPVLTLPGFRIGKTGLEKSFDSALRGTAGAAEVEVNVVGREIRTLQNRPGKQGSRIKLSIDAGLQKVVLKRLSKEVSASAVVMNAKTGAVYTLASSPGFDPNLFVRGLSAEKWEELLAERGHPLINKAVAGQYPPGSTLKMVTALAALEEGVINRHSTAFCSGHVDLGDSRFHCWRRGGHGRVDLTKALAESCDVFFYDLAVELGIDRLSRYANKMGLGESLGFELEEARSGLMPTKAWKKSSLGRGWQPGESVIASIGQGYMLATPLQLAVMTARLVNGGHAVKPWMVGAIDGHPRPDQPWPEIPVSKNHLDMIMEGMRNVMMHPRGTASAHQIDVKGMEMGGKTGTSQVKRISKEDRLANRAQEDLPWQFRHHALFVGYAPLHDPLYVCSVVVEHGGSGSGAAAPIAREILYQTQLRDPAAVPINADGRNAGLRPVSVPPQPVKGEG